VSYPQLLSGDAKTTGTASTRYTLIPNKQASGGKIVLEMPALLSDNEWDKFFDDLSKANTVLVESQDDYIGVTTKFGRVVEFWYEDLEQLKRADMVFSKTLQSANIDVKKRIVSGYEFKLLFKGRDY